MKQRLILAIDTSCDDTSAAITQGSKVLSNAVSSQENLHKKYGGVMPTLAKLEHAKRIDPVIAEALKRAGVTMSEIDAIAVTQGPGLAISLEVGLTKAKSLAKEYNIQLLAINHMEGHLLSSLAQNSLGKRSTLPEDINLNNTLGLLISGGHTEFVLVNKISNYKIVGQTLDDACGEAFDKSARVLGLGYPGGATLSNFAKEVRSNYKVAFINDNRGMKVVVTPKKITPIFSSLGKQGIELALPIPMAKSNDLNMSFSGLKTAFWQLVRVLDNNTEDKTNNPGDFSEERKEGVELNEELTKVLCLLFESAAIKQLSIKLDFALKKYKTKHVLIGGGVVNNVYGRNELRKVCKKHSAELHYPYSKKLFIDNAAMIGVAAQFHTDNTNIITLDRKPNWSIEEV